MEVPRETELVDIPLDDKSTPAVTGNNNNNNNNNKQPKKVSSKTVKNAILNGSSKKKSSKSSSSNKKSNGPSSESKKNPKKNLTRRPSIAHATIPDLSRTKAKKNEHQKLDGRAILLVAKRQLRKTTYGTASDGDPETHAPISLSETYVKAILGGQTSGVSNM